MQIISLAELAKKKSSQRSVFLLKERFPPHVQSVEPIECDYSVDNHEDFYVLTLSLFGVVHVVCQRCLHLFPYTLKLQTELAICCHEDVVEKVMKDYECVVTRDDRIDMLTIVTDNLHLYVPEKHSSVLDCADEMKQFIQ